MGNLRTTKSKKFSQASHLIVSLKLEHIATNRPLDPSQHRPEITTKEGAPAGDVGPACKLVERSEQLPDWLETETVLSLPELEMSGE